jgi:kynurenine 3-monooxygenase
MKVIYSVSRPDLNRILIDAAERAGVEIRFRTAAVGADIRHHALVLRDEVASRLEECPLRRVIAADGAGSVVRRALVSEFEVPASEDLLKHGYKELSLPPGAGGTHRIEKHALHVWPRGGFMLIALPNLDGSFTVTLFLPHQGRRELRIAHRAQPHHAVLPPPFSGHLARCCRRSPMCS